MLEKYQNIFELCKKIIAFREFRCLEQLNIECEYLIHVLNDKDFDVLKIFLYYIYYIMLDEKERNIFFNLKKLVLTNNYQLINDFRDLTEIENEFKTDASKQLYSYAYKIIQSYKGKREEIDIKEASNFIYFIYINDYTAISNNEYLTYLLGLTIYDYKKLYPIAYDMLMSRLYEVCLIIIDKVEHPEKEICKEESNFIEEANRMEF